MNIFYRTVYEIYQKDGHTFNDSLVTIFFFQNKVIFFEKCSKNLAVHLILPFICIIPVFTIKAAQHIVTLWLLFILFNLSDSILLLADGLVYFLYIYYKNVHHSLYGRNA